MSLTNPFRHPRWRYDKIMETIANRKRCRIGADVATQRALRFLREYRRREAHDDEAGLQALAKRESHLNWAYQFFTQYQREDAPLRHTLEARILAVTPPEMIAQLFSTTPAAIRWYELLFFNVLDRIEAEDWIVEEVIKPWSKWGQTDSHNWEGCEAANSLKLFGYYGGPIVLEFMLRGFRKGTRPGDFEAAREYCDNHFSDAVARRGAMTARTVHLEHFKAMPMLELHARMIELSKLHAGEEEVRNEIERNIKGMLGEMPFAVQNKDSKQLAGWLSEFDGMAAELRDGELVLVATGEMPPQVQELKKLRFDDRLVVSAEQQRETVMETLTAE